MPEDTPVGEGSATVTVQFRGAATVTRESGLVGMSFPSRTTVAIEVTTPSVEPERLTVPASPSGLARGLTALGATHETESAARSHPARRSHPPLLSVGQRFSTPDSLVPAPGEPAVVYLEDDGEAYTVTVERVRDGRNSRHADVGPDSSDSTPRHLPAGQLRPLLESTSLPVIYDDQFHWSSDLSSSI